MFKNMYLENFLVFDSIDINFEHKKNVPLKNIFIYGENGSGKTSIMKGLTAVQKIATTLNNLEVLPQNMFEQLIKMGDFISEEFGSPGSELLPSSRNKGNLSLNIKDFSCCVYT